MTKPIKLVAYLDLQEGAWPHIAAAVKHCVEQSQQEAGNIFYTVHKDNDQPNRLVFIECWAGKEVIVSHMKTMHFQNLVQVTDQYLLKPMQLTSLTEITDF